MHLKIETESELNAIISTDEPHVIRVPIVVRLEWTKGIATLQLFK